MTYALHRWKREGTECDPPAVINPDVYTSILTSEKEDIVAEFPVCMRMVSPNCTSSQPWIFKRKAHQ